MLELIFIGFFVSLGAKGGIDTYDGAKDIVTGALNSETAHDTVDKVKDTVKSVVDEVEKGAAAAKETVVEGASKAKKVVVEGVDKTKKAVTDSVHAVHERIDANFGIHKNEHRIGAQGDDVKQAATA